MIVSLFNNKLSQFSNTSKEIVEKIRFILFADICAICIGILSVFIHGFFKAEIHLIIGDLIGVVCYIASLYILSPKNLTKSINLLVGGAITAVFIHSVIGDIIVPENLSPYKVYHTLMIQLLMLIFIGVVAISKRQVIVFSIIALIVVILHFCVLVYNGVPIDGDFIATAMTITIEAVMAALGVNFFYSFSHRILNDLKEQKATITEENETVTEQNIYLERKVSQRTEDLKKSNDNLKMFSYAVSHDVREPLRMISSFLGLIQRELKQDELDRESIDEYAYFAIDGSQRLDAMINNLLVYTKLDKHKNRNLDMIDLNDIVDIVQLNLQVLVREKKAQIYVDDLPTVLVNEGNMILLFQNIIANAIKYTRPNVTPIIQITAKTTCKETIVIIEDNGRGIDQNIIDDVFKPFRRGNNPEEEKGTGIGLAICKKIVENHAGMIIVESEIGKGSRFMINLPLVVEPTLEAILN